MNIVMSKKILPILLLTANVLCSCHNDKDVANERIVCGIRVENCHYNIGIVEYSPNEHHYKRFCYILHNTTNQNIQLDSVEVSCNCISVEYSPICISACENDSIVGYIDVRDLKGVFSRSLYVNFTNGEVMLLRVRGNVI